MGKIVTKHQNQFMKHEGFKLSSIVFLIVSRIFPKVLNVSNRNVIDNLAQDFPHTHTKHVNTNLFQFQFVISFSYTDIIEEVVGT